MVAGTGQDGASDGSIMTASFRQPTGICREVNSLFVIDSSRAHLKLITSMEPLKAVSIPCQFCSEHMAFILQEKNVMFIPLPME